MSGPVCANQARYARRPQLFAEPYPPTGAWVPAVDDSDYRGVRTNNLNEDVNQ